MIEYLSIRNFKKFLSTEFHLRALSVLTGLNGTGKSTAIQALLLARQTAETATSVVQLNGPYGLALGEAADILHPGAVQTEIEIKIREAGSVSRYLYGIPDDRSLNLVVRERPDVHPDVLTGKGMAFSYLNAERLGPRDQLGVTAEEPSAVGIGARGEFTAQVLTLNETRLVREPLRHPRTPEHGVATLRTQVELWASEIIRPIQIVSN